MASPTAVEMQELFRSIIEGKVVKRSRHELRWDDRDVSQAFVETLQKCGYRATNVEAVHVVPGERVPAFYIEKNTVFFGWVFWEKFTETRMRKLFGSVVRNAKGDWSIQIPPTRQTVIYANERLKIEMDVDHPSDF